MFGEAQRRKAVDVCFRGCVTLKKVIAELGYPSEGCLTNWMARDPRHGRRSPPYTLDVRARAAGRVIAGERCVDVAKDVGRSATSVRKRAGAYGREGIGGLMNMGDGIRVPAVDDGVFSQVGVSFWGWCRFVGLVVDSITTDHATRPSSRRRSMMLMPNSVLIRLSRYRTM